MRLRAGFAGSSRLGGHPIRARPFNLIPFRIATYRRGSRPFLAPRLLALYSRPRPRQRGHGARHERNAPASLGKDVRPKRWAVGSKRSCRILESRPPRALIGLVDMIPSIGISCADARNGRFDQRAVVQCSSDTPRRNILCVFSGRAQDSASRSAAATLGRQSARGTEHGVDRIPSEISSRSTPARTL